jgi:diguanylate cyclase (GGDEF)-like protein/PAS domain S-box-containing protein
MGAARGRSDWLHEGSIGDVRSVLDHAHEAFIAMDVGGFVIDWNRQAQRTFGWSSEEAIGQVLADLIIPPRDRAAHTEGLRRYLDGGRARILDKRLELSAIDRTGREFPVELTISHHDAAPEYFFAFLVDISQRRLSERLLRAQLAITRVFAQALSSDQAMRELVATLGEAMEWQLGAWWSQAEGSEVLRCRSVWRSEAAALEFEQITLALELAQGVALPGRVWASGQPEWTADLAADPSVPRAQMALRAGLHASLCVPVLVQGEFHGAIEFFSGQVGEPARATREILGTIAEQIGSFMSVLDERSDLLMKLQRLALTDDLTGLANRRAWQDNLEREIAAARRSTEPLCVAMLDLDHFKRFNDAHGHQAGDRLLIELAHAWRTQLRASDILARYGGEEFALLLPASPIEAASKVLARVRTATPEGQTCSAGLAAFNGSESPEQLIGRADAALYEAKARGRNRTVIAKADRSHCTRLGEEDSSGS